MRSAERGPTPGICRNCVIKSRSASGYSVLLKTLSPSPARARQRGSDPPVRLGPIAPAFPLNAARAVQGGADKDSAAHLPHGSARAPFEIRCRLRPNAALGTKRRRSKKNLAAPLIRWVHQRRKRAVHKFHVAPGR